jgi:DNA-binding NtrC family response regulator
VLSDINMPEMDGFTLISKLNEHHAVLKSVIVSAYGDMENFRTAMNRGAFDFVIRPVDFNNLELTIEKTLKHVNQMGDAIMAVFRGAYHLDRAIRDNRKLIPESKRIFQLPDDRRSNDEE